MSKEQIERMAEDRCLVSNTPTDTPTQNQFTNYELDQIDEMANTLFLVNESLDTVYMDDCEKIAKVLYKAGWRKQSEVIDEIVARLKERLYTIPTVYNAHFSRMLDDVVTSIERERR